MARFICLRNRFEIDFMFWPDLINFNQLRLTDWSSLIGPQHPLTEYPPFQHVSLGWVPGEALWV